VASGSFANCVPPTPAPCPCRYKHECSALLTQALMSLEQIDRVRYVDCSFPSVPSEAPRLSLDLWHSLSASEWQLRWSPSWSMQAHSGSQINLQHSCFFQYIIMHLI